MTVARDLIAEASAALGAAQSTTGQVSAFYLANARLALEAARVAVDQLSIVISAREAEAVRLTKLEAAA